MFSFRSSLHYDVSLLSLKSTKFWGFTQPMLQCHKSHCKTTLPTEKRNICRSAPTCVILMNLCPILHWKLTNSEMLLRQETGGVKLTKCRIPYGGICGSCWRLYFLSPVILRWTVTMHKNWVTKNDIRPALGPPLPLSQLERAWNNSRCNNPCNQIVVNIEFHLLWLFLFLTNIILIRYILDAGKKDKCMREKQ